MNDPDTSDSTSSMPARGSSRGDAVVLIGLVGLVAGGGGFGALTTLFPTVDHRGPVYAGFILTWMWAGVPLVGCLGYLIWKRLSPGMITFAAAMGFALVSLLGIDAFLMVNALGAPRTSRIVELPIVDRSERNSSRDVRYDVRFICPDQPGKICVLGVDSAIFTKAVPNETLLVGSVYRGWFGYDIWLGEPRIERRSAAGAASAAP